VQRHYSPDRLTVPMIRKSGELKQSSWEEAMTLLTNAVAPADKAGGASS